MKIGGYRKNSRVDFPGKAAAVVYTQGCNWRCPYCHSRCLVMPARFQPAIPEPEFFAALEAERPNLDALVVTGGEPTVQPDLASFLRRIKAIGLKTKLDTNGSRPGVIAALLDQQLLDFIAMDVKGPLTSYASFAGVNVDPGMIELSIELIRSSGVGYEFRTTVVGGLHQPADLRALAPLMSGSQRYALQAYQPPPGKTIGFESFTVPTAALFHEAGDVLREHVEEFIIRS
jgi:pyruvate formate lyase activating enzyme